MGKFNLNKRTDHLNKSVEQVKLGPVSRFAWNLGFMGVSNLLQRRGRAGLSHTFSAPEPWAAVAEVRPRQRAQGSNPIHVRKFIELTVSETISSQVAT